MVRFLFVVFLFAVTGCGAWEGSDCLEDPECKNTAANNLATNNANNSNNVNNTNNINNLNNVSNNANNLNNTNNTNNTNQTNNTNNADAPQVLQFATGAGNNDNADISFPAETTAGNTVVLVIGVVGQWTPPANLTLVSTSGSMGVTVYIAHADANGDQTFAFPVGTQSWAAVLIELDRAATFVEAVEADSGVTPDNQLSVGPTAATEGLAISAGAFARENDTAIWSDGFQDLASADTGGVGNAAFSLTVGEKALDGPGTTTATWPSASRIAISIGIWQ